MSDPISREEAANVVRSIFRRCGYCIAEHGTRGRDLDLVAVPWTDRAGMPSIIVGEVIEALGGRMLGDPEQKPHGRAAYAIAPGHQRPHDMWYVDLSVVVPTEYRDEIMPRRERLRAAALECDPRHADAFIGERMPAQGDDDAWREVPLSGNSMRDTWKPGERVEGSVANRFGVVVSVDDVLLRHERLRVRFDDGEERYINPDVMRHA